MAENIHASAVIVGRRGVLVKGPSNAGKTSFCFDLVALAQASGIFACWVADDQVMLSSSNGKLVARPPGTIAGLAELRGFGPASVAAQPAAVIDLVVRLVEPADAPRLPDPENEILAGVALPLLRLPARSGGVAARAGFAEINQR